MSYNTNNDLLDLHTDQVMDTVVTMDSMDYGHHDHHGHHEFPPGQHPPEECIPEGEIDHLHDISLSNSDLLTESQLVRAVNLSSLDEVLISCWNVDINWEKESDREAEALKS